MGARESKERGEEMKRGLLVGLALVLVCGALSAAIAPRADLYIKKVYLTPKYFQPGDDVLLVINLDRDWRLKVYYMDVIQRRAVWLLLAGAAGVVVYWTARRLLPRAVADLREGTHIRRGKQTARHLKDLKGGQKGTPT